jgi:ABC-2 type transport system permease protein
MRIFASGLRKLVRRPATWVTALLLVGLLVLVFLAVGASARQAPTPQQAQNALLLVTFPGAYFLVLSFILGLGGLLGVIYGAAIAGSEWSWGTLKAAVARGESRSGYLLASFGSVGVVVGVGLLISFVIGVLAAIVAAKLAGVSTDGLGDSAVLGQMPQQLLRGWLALSEEAALGFAIATIARSQLAGIGAGIGVYFGEQFASIFLPDVVKYLPFAAAQAVVSTSQSGISGGGAAVRGLAPDTALIVVAVWFVAALGVTALFTERAEISG